MLPLTPKEASKANFIRQMAHCGRTQTPQLRACFQTVCHTMELDAHSLSAVADQLVEHVIDVLIYNHSVPFQAMAPEPIRPTMVSIAV